MRASVDASVRAGSGHRSDQSAVWREVETLHARQATSSPTGAMQGAFEGRSGELQRFVDAFPQQPGQQGLLVLLGGAVVGLDFVSIPEKYARLHAKLVRSYALEALGVAPDDDAGAAPADARAVARRFLARLAGLAGERFKSPGLGWDTRLAGEGAVGSLLTYRGRPVHAAFFATDGDGDGHGRGALEDDASRMAGARDRARLHGRWGGSYPAATGQPGQTSPERSDDER